MVVIIAIWKYTMSGIILGSHSAYVTHRIAQRLCDTYYYCHFIDEETEAQGS